jgi:hypothetical protein
MSRFRLTPTAYVLIGMAIGGLAGACAAGANQPNMVAALNSLRAARAELIQATPNKGIANAPSISSTPPSARPRPASPTPATELQRG